MELFELVTVEHTFWINQNSVNILIIHPDFSVPKAGWKEHTETVVVRKPDGQEFEANAHLGLSHINTRDPHASIDRRWRVTMWLTNNSKDEVPTGSKVFVSQQLKETLTTASSPTSL